jgi:serine/threonine-protein phosphatase 2B catalytic subunit
MSSIEDTDTMSASSSGDEMEVESTTPSEQRNKKLHEAKLPTAERIMKDVPMPTGKILQKEDLFDETGIPNPDVLRNHLKQEGKLAKDLLLEIISQATQILVQEPNVLAIKEPVTICGDIHGQYFDLLKLFDVGGDPKNTQYLFLGDYVDRGYFSLECVLLLYTYKINRPDNFFLLRGNHECRHLTDYFTFKEECEKKYDSEVYDAFMDSFDTLPLAALILNSQEKAQFLCVHGGLSPDIETLEDIENINRFREPPPNGPMCDILWADPAEDYANDDIEFKFNSVRGCSYSYGYRAVSNFLERNSILTLIRAHEAQDEGFRMYKKSLKTQFPTCITIFSAPNYLEAYNNKAAIMIYANNVINIKQFNNTQHPYWLPGFMDVFTWSMPFLAEKVSEILLVFLNLVNDEEAEREEQQLTEEEKLKRRQIVTKKIQSVSRLLRLFNILRTEREMIMKIKGLSPNSKLPPGLLLKGPAAISEALGNFQKAKVADRPNEARPPGVDKFLEKTPSSPRLNRSGSRPILDGLRRSGSFSANLVQPAKIVTPPHSPMHPDVEMTNTNRITITESQD